MKRTLIISLIVSALILLMLTRRREDFWATLGDYSGWFDQVRPTWQGDLRTEFAGDRFVRKTAS